MVVVLAALRLVAHSLLPFDTPPSLSTLYNFLSGIHDPS